MRCAVSSRAVAALLAGLAVAGCGRAQQTPPGVTVDAPAAAGAVSSAPHGDHNPRHGGIVMMKGENLHYEVVLDASGRSHRLFFTDATREDLPASTASAA